MKKQVEELIEVGVPNETINQIVEQCTQLINQFDHLVISEKSIAFTVSTLKQYEQYYSTHKLYISNRTFFSDMILSIIDVIKEYQDWIKAGVINENCRTDHFIETAGQFLFQDWKKRKGQWVIGLSKNWNTLQIVLHMQGPQQNSDLETEEHDCDDPQIEERY